MNTTTTARQRKALDWHESHFGDSEFVREWKRYILAKEAQEQA